MPPPDAYTVPTAEPVIVPVGPRLTNGVLAESVLDLRHALSSCNADKAAIREWAAQLLKE